MTGPALPECFLRTPLAHRALHDVNDGRPENSIAAIDAAVAAGYGIEIDLQLSADGHAVVFHDYDLGRLTGVSGAVRQRNLSDLQAVPLLHGDGAGMPSLSEVLELVAGRVPLLIEFKDQDGAMGPNTGALEQAALEALTGYTGPVALMSFNPHCVAELARLAPQLPHGLVTDSYESDEWPLKAETRAHLRAIPDFDRTGSSFISHNVHDLDRPRVHELKAQGVPILCWTVKSPTVEAQARHVANNVTFEGYRAAIPA
ncbi:MAG: glycerophosphodiester phosphodiesterase family protein [Paracoccaceae bacterium]